MLRVPIGMAREGMFLATGVCHPKRAERVLLREGVRLDSHTIERLASVGIGEVWVRYPGLEFIATHMSPELAESRHELRVTIGQAFHRALRDAHAELDYDRFQRAVRGVLSALLTNRRAPLLLEELGAAGSPALRHAGNVCFISLLLGLKLSDYLLAERRRLSGHIAKDVTTLGVGAMLHDIGMLRLPRPVLQRWNTRQDECDAEWREHTRLGYEMVRGHVEPAAAAAVLHHHQRFDGQGFPVRRQLDGAQVSIEGRRIHVFARVIAAADLFDRLRNPAHAPLADFRAGVSAPAVRALRWVREPPLADRLDPLVVSGLMAVAPPYPPGTIVRLSTGDEAAVTAWHPDEPCRPRVALIPGFSDGASAPGGELIEVDLREHPTVTIAEADGHDVREDNFFSRRPGEFDLDAQLRMLIARPADRAA